MWTVIAILGALSLGMCGGFILGALVNDGAWRRRLQDRLPDENPHEQAYKEMRPRRRTSYRKGMRKPYLIVMTSFSAELSVPLAPTLQLSGEAQRILSPSPRTLLPL